MDYKTKIRYAEEVAKQLQKRKSTDLIKSELKTEGLYENDISNIIVSARNILGEIYQPKIKEYLLEDKKIHGSEEFDLLDAEVVDTLIAKEIEKFALQEKKKITQLMKEGQPVEQIFAQVDTRFLSVEKATEQISHLQGVKRQNSGSGRMLNIFGGIGLIVLTGVLAITINRLFYVLPIIGIIMIVKGVTTKKMEYDG